MPGEFEDLWDRCFPLAEEVYWLGQKCLLAHAVRAVESILFEHRRTFLKHKTAAYPILIIIKKGISLRQHRRAIVFTFPTRAEIYVDSEIGHQYQRMAVAHELAHVLLAVKFGNKLPPKATEEHEQWCKEFEDRLCRLLHNLYERGKFTDKSKFPDHEQYCVENQESLKKFLADPWQPLSE